MSSRNPLKEITLLILTLFGTLGIVVCILWLYKFIFADGLSTGEKSATSELSKGENSGTSPNCKNFPTGLFNYGGSTTWAPIRRDVDPVIQKICPQFQLRYTDHPISKPGSGTGIQMLLENQLDFSQSSRSIKPEEQQKAQQKGFNIKEIPVAIDGIAIAINPQLKVPGLTVEQIKQIYTGQITNWNQVGGIDLKIIPYSRRKEDAGTVEFFVENVLQKEEFGKNVEYVYSTTDGLQKIAKNIGGIYYGSAPEIVGQCQVNPLPLINQSQQTIPPYKEPFIPPERCPNQRNSLNASAFKTGEYPITRKLFVIIMENNAIQQQAGEAYASWLLTNEAQILIEKAGFVKLR